MARGAGGRVARLRLRHPGRGRVAGLTGEPDGPPTLPGYSAVDNSSAIMAALALVAKVHEGKGGQVDVSLFDVMLSQLNYKAAEYLNGGEIPGAGRSARTRSTCRPSCSRRLRATSRCS